VFTTEYYYIYRKSFRIVRCECMVVWRAVVDHRSSNQQLVRYAVRLSILIRVASFFQSSIATSLVLTFDRRQDAETGLAVTLCGSWPVDSRPSHDVRVARLTILPCAAPLRSTHSFHKIKSPEAYRPRICLLLNLLSMQDLFLRTVGVIRSDMIYCRCHPSPP
jgi:hypothetical protein